MCGRPERIFLFLDGLPFCVVERMGDPSAARVDFVPGIVWGEKLFYIRREEAYRFIINISLQIHIIIYMTSLCACQQHDVIRMTSPLPPRA